MSELIDNSRQRKEVLRGLILRLHSGEDPHALRIELEERLHNTPPGEVIEVEQELISEGVPVSEILEHCDAHSLVLRNNLDLRSRHELPPGHPCELLLEENRALIELLGEIEPELDALEGATDPEMGNHLLSIRGKLNRLMDVDKHYKRKEYLLFPFLERYGFPGPSEVMWGKHDQIREQLEGSLEILAMENVAREELQAGIELVVAPALRAIRDMVDKEEQILLPVLLDKLTEADWLQVHAQTMDYGFCLIEPRAEWAPAGEVAPDAKLAAGTIEGIVQLAAGRIPVETLEKILDTLPVDITFVDHEDKVRYFSQGRERIFQRSRAILGRSVKHCHPPASAHIVEKILLDFRSGRESRAPFWIQMGPRMIHIEYFALRSDRGEYLGTLEVSQNVTPYRELEGEQRILEYTSETNG
jgi:hypothetical protein